MHLPERGRIAGPSVAIEEVLQRRTDLSTFVVHLTRDRDGRTARENLESIIDEQLLRAVFPRGWATREAFRLDDPSLATQRAVCFSETPLEHVHALFADIAGRSIHFAPYGVAFPKMVARAMGINPVWYVDFSRGSGAGRHRPIKDALNALVKEAAGDFAVHPVSRLTPFIEGMGSWSNGNGGVRRREFSWEREWRHLGDLDLSPWWSKALWLCPQDELDVFSARLGTDRRCIDPAWGLERIIGHLLELGEAEMTPFAAR